MPEPEVRLIYADAAMVEAIARLRDALTIAGTPARRACDHLQFEWAQGVRLPAREPGAHPAREAA